MVRRKEGLSWKKAGARVGEQRWVGSRRCRGGESSGWGLREWCEKQRPVRRVSDPRVSPDSHRHWLVMEVQTAVRDSDDSDDSRIAGEPRCEILKLDDVLLSLLLHPFILLTPCSSFLALITSIYFLSTSPCPFQRPNFRVFVGEDGQALGVKTT